MANALSSSRHNNAMPRRTSANAMNAQYSYAATGPKPNDIFDRGVSSLQGYGKDVLSGKIAREGLTRMLDIGDRALAGDSRAGQDFINEFGIAGTIGGVGAKTADLIKQKMAQEMKSADMPREDIWNKTGWFEGVDGKWRFEIDDSKAVMKPSGLKEFNEGISQTQGSMMKHDELSSAYPDSNWIGYSKGADSGASYDPFADRIYLPQGAGDPSMFPEMRDLSVKSPALHELQHAIQGREGFARGGAPEGPYQGSELNDLIQKKYIQIKDIPGNFGETEQALRSHARMLVNSEEGRYQAYKSLAGETEARTVQTRMNLTPDERQTRPFWEDYDVPEADQIVRYK